jgi:hypothetical protein
MAEIVLLHLQSARLVVVAAQAPLVVLALQLWQAMAEQALRLRFLAAASLMVAAAAVVFCRAELPQELAVPVVVALVEKALLVPQELLIQAVAAAAVALKQAARETAAQAAPAS